MTLDPDVCDANILPNHLTRHTLDNIRATRYGIAQVTYEGSRLGALKPPKIIGEVMELPKGTPATLPIGDPFEARLARPMQITKLGAWAFTIVIGYDYTGSNPNIESALQYLRGTRWEFTDPDGSITLPLYRMYKESAEEGTFELKCRIVQVLVGRPKDGIMATLGTFTLKPPIRLIECSAFLKTEEQLADWMKMFRL